MRFLLRFLSLVSLAAATIAGTLDSIQSIAASKVHITSLADGWKSLHPASYEKWHALFSDPAQPHFYDQAGQWILQQPAFGVLLVASLLFWMVGYRRRLPPAGLAA